MTDIAGLVLFRNCVGISTSSPDAEVKRIANESPYTIVVATSLLRGAIARSVTKVFEVILYLRLLRARAALIIYRIGIATAPERLRHLQRDCCLPRTSSPIAWGFAGQLLERRGERSLGSVAKLRRHRHDRPVGIAQHVHVLLEPMLAQPSMRRK